MLVDCCNLCGCQKSRVVWKETVGDVVKCERCGFIYSRLVPNVSFERAESASTIFAETSARKKKVYEQILPLIMHKSGGRLLDVGCRTGNFLLLAKNKGFDVEGIEPSQKFAQFTREMGLTVHSNMLRGSAFPANRFDIIAYLEVLEHIATPWEELTEVHRVLKDDGILVLEVPNIYFQLTKTRIARLLHLSGYGLMPDDHLVHFSEQTIKALLSKADFQITAILDQYLCTPPHTFILLKYLLSFHSKFAHFTKKAFRINIDRAIIVVAGKKEPNFEGAQFTRAIENPQLSMG